MFQCSDRILNLSDSVSDILNLGFTPCDGWLREFGLCVSHIYNPVEQEVMAGQCHAPGHPGVLNCRLNLNWNI